MNLYIENQFTKSLDLKGFSSHNGLMTQMILTDLGSAKNAKEDYEKDIVIAKTSIFQFASV